MIPALLDHMWQSTLYAAAAGLLTLALRGNGARIRYWIWLSASVKFLIPLHLLVALGDRLGQWGRYGRRSMQRLRRRLERQGNRRCA